MRGKRSFGLDLLKVIAAVGVLAWHTILFSHRADLWRTPFWWACEPILIVGAMSTNIFFMVSGYLAAGKKVMSLRDHTRRVLWRLGAPLVIFSILHGLSEYWWINPVFPANTAILWRVAFWDVMTSTRWFLVYLLVWQLLQPVWQILLEREHRHVLRFALAVMTITLVILQTYLGERTFGMPVFLVGSLWCYLFGALARVSGWRQLGWRTSLVIFGISFLMIGVSDFWPTVPLLLYVHHLATYSGALALFTLLAPLPAGSPIASTILSTAASFTYGVYLWQQIVITWRYGVWHFEYDTAGLSPWAYATANFCFVLSASLALTILGRWLLLWLTQLTAHFFRKM